MNNTYISTGFYIRDDIAGRYITYSDNRIEIEIIKGTDAGNFNLHEALNLLNNLRSLYVSNTYNTTPDDIPNDDNCDCRTCTATTDGTN